MPKLSMMSENDKCAIFGKKLVGSNAVSGNTEENMQSDEVSWFYFIQYCDHFEVIMKF